MKKVYIVLLSILGFIIFVALAAGSLLKFYFPNMDEAPKLSIKITPERIEKGRYLAYNVAVCMDCHSSRDWTTFAAPLKDNLGGGGEKFGREMGFPGDIYSPNITPYSLGNWTDGEIYRAITSGVNKNGDALFPVMPYHNYGQMDQEDIFNIIAYLRSIEPIESSTPKRELDFPLNLIINTMPKEAQVKTRPSPDDQVAYGGYLVNVSGCVNCHSKRDKGSIIPGTEFGGGMEFKQVNGIVRSPNISPDKTTGIGKWTKESFVQRFKQYSDSTHIPKKLGKNDFNSPMPWYMYAGMKESDLEAIYSYLKSIKPIDNPVNRYEIVK